VCGQESNSSLEVMHSGIAYHWYEQNADADLLPINHDKVMTKHRNLIESILMLPCDIE
jgi:hypothetical protein